MLNLIKILFEKLDFWDCLLISSTCKTLRSSNFGNWKIFNKLRTNPFANIFMEFLCVENQYFMSELVVFLNKYELEQVINCCWNFVVLERINRRAPIKDFKIKYFVMHYIKCYYRRQKCNICEVQQADFMSQVINYSTISISNDMFFKNTIYSNISSIVLSQDIDLLMYISKIGINPEDFIVNPEMRLTRFLYKKYGVRNVSHAGFLLNYPEGDNIDVLEKITNIDLIYGSDRRILRWIRLHKPNLNTVVKWFFSVSRTLDLRKILKIYNVERIEVHIKMSPNIECVNRFSEFVSNYDKIKR